MMQKISSPDQLISFLSQQNLQESSKRLFHGRGLCFGSTFQHIAIDYHPGLLYLTYFRPLEESSELNKALEMFCLQIGLGLKIQYRFKKPIENTVIVESDSQFAMRGDLKFHLNQGTQQNSGFFLDMEQGRQWLEQIIQTRKTHNKPSRILNLFSYTCAFSVIAAKQDADSVCNVDMSSAVLTTGRKNHQVNQLSTHNISFLKLNIMKSWGRLKREGPFDIIIIDPPSFQPGSFIAEKQYATLARRVQELCSEDCDLLACLNAPEIPISFLRQQFSEQFENAKEIKRLKLSSGFEESDEEAGLKVIHYQAIK